MCQLFAKRFSNVAALVSLWFYYSSSVAVTVVFGTRGKIGHWSCCHDKLLTFTT